VWSLLKTRRWIAFTLLVVIAITSFGLLSRWQWQRAEEERTARVAWATQAAVQAQSIADAITDPREWTPVRVGGQFDPGSTVLVRQRPLDGRNGFWVVTALDTDQGRVWVNRGWIPATGAATGTVAAPLAPSGSVVVEGRLRLAESSGSPEPGDLPEGQVSALVPSRLGADVDTFYLEATASEPTDPDVTRMPAPVIDETQNISYALQWLVFAAVAITGWWFFLRREAREDAATGDMTVRDVS
jgi:cytochrome oxidase assembly protein ShyY1